MNDAHRCGCTVCVPPDEEDVAPCEHCGDDVTPDDAFRIVHGFLLHERCIEAWEATA